MLPSENNDASNIYARLARAVSLGTAADGISGLIYGVAADMVAAAEKFSWRGNLWELFFAMAAASGENPICVTYERRPAPAGVFRMLVPSLLEMRNVFDAVKKLIAEDDEYEPLRMLGNFTPGIGVRARVEHAYAGISELAGKFAASASPCDMASALADFRSRHGTGKFALNCAFRWDSSAKRLISIDDVDPITLASLTGYEDQKRELLANTEVFVSGSPSNNVLLFGDSGTGKSSSVRALLNEPGFVKNGLRMIELRQNQFEDIPYILNVIRNRNYRFVLFMDDLSFEESEAGYKHLKALIEGGLERKPDNAVIYATSNRRHIIREVWGDRASSSDDVHGWDTMQEKHSLADRFGVTIWYPSVSKDIYLSIVKAISDEMGLVMDETEMARLAMRWELERGGFTGRVARQFVYHMLQRKGARS